MAKHKITLNPLSQNSIQNAIKALQSYQDSLTYNCQLLAEKLAEKGVEIARVEISDLDAVFTSELLQSVHSEYKGSVKGGGVWAVVTDSEHATFVEFGTGIIGKANPYKGTLPEGVDWQYASGKTIRQLADGRYGWFYKGKDGNWYFTEGMPSRPFMYNTANELKSIIVSTAREVFG
nr:MAG TPA: tail component protein [Bacteriophage sp.]